METLVFKNPGEIDIRGACIAGLSAKETDSPIGYFGTGLKYSIACILRWGGEITIYSGTTEHKFFAEDLIFRGQEFKQIIMSTRYEDGSCESVALGFTTEYGKNWKHWQVFRELYANARDEGGEVQMSFFTDKDPRFQYSIPDVMQKDHTTIIVSGVPALIESFLSRNDIILPTSMKWDFEFDRVQFTNAQSGGIYYRGVRVFEQACLYTWNFLNNLTLTEDRTLNSVMAVSYYFDRFLERDLHDIDIVMNLLQMKYEDRAVKITRIVEYDGEPKTLEERPIEALFMDWYNLPDMASSTHSDEFKEACKRLYQRDPTTYSRLRTYVKSIDKKLVEDKLYIMNRREQAMFDKAKTLVSMFGFEEEVKELPIHVQELGGLTLGLYEQGSVYLSPKLFDQGTKQLTATLYEECYHHRTQKVDCTYNMQSDLFNIIVSLNEELHGVIC